MSTPKSREEYKTQFIKGGLTPKEFERCLGMKVDKLLRSNLPAKTEELIEKAKQNVKQQVCIRENETDPLTLDQRYTKSLHYYNQEEILTGGQHPKRIVKQTSGHRGVTKSNKRWQKTYHEEQHTLFTMSFIQNILRCEFPQIRLEENQRGYLFDVSGKLSPKEFCRVIDHITADLVEELSTLSRGNHNSNYTTQWQQRLGPLSQSCKKILKLRLVLDFFKDNDLMDKKGYEVWRDHLMVMMSFAAMLVVAEAFIDSLNKKWGPNPPPKPAKSAQICRNPPPKFAKSAQICPNPPPKSAIKALAWLNFLPLLVLVLFFYSSKKNKA